MRILHVVNATVGGVGGSTLEAMRGLRATGIESSLVYHPVGADAPAEEFLDVTDGRCHAGLLYFTNRRVRHRPGRRVASLGHQLVRTAAGTRGPNTIARVATEDGCDVIHTQAIVTPDGAIAARRLGLPHVWHLRELVGPDHPVDLCRMAPVSRLLADPGSALVAVSETSARTFETMAGPTPHTVLPNPVDLDLLGGLHRPPLGPDRLPVVAMIANLSASWKRHDVFIRACAQVRSAARFVVFGNLPGRSSGSHPYLAELRSLARDLGMPDLEFAGHASQETMYSSTDVLVHTSGRESFGRVYAEAMAAGVPVVAVEGGAASEVIDDGETGILVSDDPAAIATEVDRLLQEPELAAGLAARGRSHAQRSFGRDHHAARLATIYAEVIEETRATSGSGMAAAWLHGHR